MMEDKFLERLDRLNLADMRQFMKSFLAAEGIRPASETQVLVKASEALRIWETRLKNTALTKRTIAGAQSLVSGLHMVHPDADVEQLAFIGRGFAGNLFFDVQSGDFLGFAMTDLPEAAPLS